MKLTGLILIVVGLIGGAICVLQMVMTARPDVPNAGDVQAHAGNLAIPLTLCAVACGVGLLMLLFGGKGYIVSDNPSVRN